MGQTIGEACLEGKARAPSLNTLSFQTPMGYLLSDTTSYIDGSIHSLI